VLRRRVPDPPRPGDLMDLLGAVPFGEAGLPERGGCYVYALDDAAGRCFYIGQSSSLLTRLGSWQAVHGGRIAGIRVLRCRDAGDMDVTENFLVYRMQPAENISGTENEERRRRARARQAPRPRSPGTYDRDKAEAWVRAREAS
jgi:hypothetical protein